MTEYFRPILQSGSCRPEGAIGLAGGALWFVHVERLTRGEAGRILPVAQVPEATLERLRAKRAGISGLSFERPNIMGILNLTPDSFSDGGKFEAPETALEHARHMVAHGADILDVGGESTRPNAEVVSVEDEISRTIPIIRSISDSINRPISIDTRKFKVAAAAVSAGAGLVNDVAAFTYDPAMKDVVACSGAAVCLMHAQGDPATMQDAPFYENVVLDVYDFLEERIAFAIAAGISRDRIIIDPGIGFGKTMQHNLDLLQNISLFHGLGCAILLGVSRKRFIGRLSGVGETKPRVMGSVAVALAAVAQGVQVLRVHDVDETKQALNLWQAVNEGLI